MERSLTKLKCLKIDLASMCQLADSMSLLEKMLVGGSQKRVSLTVETVVINDALQSFEPNVEFQM